MTLAFIFPGQGSQAPGMGKALYDAFPAARSVVEEVDAALNQKLSQLMFEGPAEELTLTENAQPALLACSLMVMRALEAEHGVKVGTAAFVAGHSLGETSALCAAGGVSLADAARFVKARGRAMQAAVPVGVGAMAALLGAEMEQAPAACGSGSARSPTTTPPARS
jgi:[acyl-carrier-protein] S-malonyltransferase